MKAPRAMVVAVREVSKARRLEAMRVAEKVFFERLAKYRADNDMDFDDADFFEWAAQSAAAEVAYRFT